MEPCDHFTETERDPCELKMTPKCRQQCISNSGLNFKKDRYYGNHKDIDFSFNTGIVR